MIATRLPRSVLGLGALAAVALLLSAVAALLPHGRGGALVVAHGRTDSGARVAFALRGGHVSAFAVGAVNVNCSYGWRFAGPMVSGTIDGANRFVARGVSRRAYPNGSSAFVARATLTGASGGSHAVAGTVAYAVTVYNEGRVVNRCAAPVMRFAAR